MDKILNIVNKKMQYYSRAENIIKNNNEKIKQYFIAGDIDNMINNNIIYSGNIPKNNIQNIVLDTVVRYENYLRGNYTFIDIKNIDALIAESTLAKNINCENNDYKIAEFIIEYYKETSGRWDFYKFINSCGNKSYDYKKSNIRYLLFILSAQYEVKNLRYDSVSDINIDKMIAAAMDKL